MKKKHQTTIIIIVFLAVISSLLLIAKFNQNVFGIDSIIKQDKFSLGTSSSEFFGYKIEANIQQGIKDGCANPSSTAACGVTGCSVNEDGCPIYALLQKNPTCPYGSRCIYYTAPSGGWGGCSQTPSGCGSGGGGTSYNNLECRYLIKVNDKEFKGDTRNSQPIILDDLYLQISGSEIVQTGREGTVTTSAGDLGTKIDPTTKLPYASATKTTSVDTVKNVCNGLYYKASINLPQDKLDLTISNNTVTFTNNWRDMKGTLCVAINTTELKGTCFNTSDLKVGVYSAQFDLPSEKAGILPVLRNVEIEGTLIGDLTGSWFYYEPARVINPEVTTKEQQVTIPALMAEQPQPIAEMNPELKSEIKYENIFQKFYKWLLSLL